VFGFRFFVPLYVIRLSRQNLTTEAHFFQNRQQRYNNFSRYANNVLIYMRVRVFSIFRQFRRLKNEK